MKFMKKAVPQTRAGIKKAEITICLEFKPVIGNQIIHIYETLTSVPSHRRWGGMQKKTAHKPISNSNNPFYLIQFFPPILAYRLPPAYPLTGAVAAYMKIAVLRTEPRLILKKNLHDRFFCFLSQMNWLTLYINRQWWQHKWPKIQLR